MGACGQLHEQVYYHVPDQCFFSSAEQFSVTTETRLLQCAVFSIALGLLPEGLLRCILGFLVYVVVYMLPFMLAYMFVCLQYIC